MHRPVPLRGGVCGDSVPFATEFPSAGRYRRFFQVKHDARVHTAAFTQDVTR